MSRRIEAGRVLSGNVGAASAIWRRALPSRGNEDVTHWVFGAGHDIRRKGNAYRKPRGKVGEHRPLDLRRSMRSAVEHRGPQNVISTLVETVSDGIVDVLIHRAARCTRRRGQSNCFRPPGGCGVPIEAGVVRHTSHSRSGNMAVVFAARPSEGSEHMGASLSRGIWVFPKASTGRWGISCRS